MWCISQASFLMSLFTNLIDSAPNFANNRPIRATRKFWIIRANWHLSVFHWLCWWTHYYNVDTTLTAARTGEHCNTLNCIGLLSRANQCHTDSCDSYCLNQSDNIKRRTFLTLQSIIEDLAEMPASVEDKNVVALICDLTFQHNNWKDIFCLPQNVHQCLFDVIWNLLNKKSTFISECPRHALDLFKPSQNNVVSTFAQCLFTLISNFTNVDVIC